MAPLLPELVQSTVVPVVTVRRLRRDPGVDFQEAPRAHQLVSRESHLRRQMRVL